MKTIHERLTELCARHDAADCYEDQVTTLRELRSAMPQVLQQIAAWIEREGELLTTIARQRSELEQARDQVARLVDEGRSFPQSTHREHAEGS